MVQVINCSRQQRPIAGAFEVAFSFSVDPKKGHVRHVGILLIDESTKEVRHLHLAWHDNLRFEPAGDIEWWMLPGVDPDRLVLVATEARHVWRENQSHIPYAFSQPVDCFDLVTHKYLFGPTKLGLTCATFVLAVFQCAGVPLVDCLSWPLAHERPDDVAFQEMIIDQLRTYGADCSHVEKVERQVGMSRFRPAEVLGAGAEKSTPASFPVVERNVAKLYEAIEAAKS